MIRRYSLVVGALVLGFSIFATSSAALEVDRTELSGGVIKIDGKNAQASATITWEGGAVTTANNKGKFQFTTTVVPAQLPTDCLGIGTLSDGTDTIDVLVPLCDKTQVTVVMGGGGGDILFTSSGASTGSAEISHAIFNVGYEETIPMLGFPLPRAGVIQNLTVRYVRIKCFGTPLECSTIPTLPPLSLTVTLLLNGQPTNLSLVHDGAVGDIRSNTNILDSVIVSAGDTVIFQMEPDFPIIPFELQGLWLIAANFQ